MKTPALTLLRERLEEQVEIIALREELDNLVNECYSVTRTNCGWREYYVAKVVRDYASYIHAIQRKGITND